MAAPFSDKTLHAYVDGLLPPDESAQVERWLADQPDVMQKVRHWQQLNVELIAAYPLPEDNWQADLTLPKQPSRWPQMAALLLAGLLGSALGWNLKPMPSVPEQLIQVLPLEQRLLQPARVSHLVYTPEVVHPVEVRSEQQQHLVTWLSKRMGLPIKAPDLNAEGFSLMGGRLLPAESGPAAQFMYENSRGERLTLYVKQDTASDGQTAFHRYQRDGISSFYWLDNGLGYVLSGALSPEALQASANRVYRQLSF